jgi:hypothetical protein
MSARGRSAGKLSVLSPGLVRGEDRPSAALEPTIGKLSVLSAAPPAAGLSRRDRYDGVPAGALAAAPVPLARTGPVASAGGTAMKESVISHGGTPVFGHGASAGGLAAVGNAGPASGCPAVAGPGSFAGLLAGGNGGAAWPPLESPASSVPATLVGLLGAPGSVGGLIARGKGPRSG